MVNQTLEWFQSSQRNIRASIDRDIESLESLKRNIENDEKRFAFRQRQIDEAIRRGKETFNDTRFLVKRTLLTEGKK